MAKRERIVQSMKNAVGLLLNALLISVSALAQQPAVAPSAPAQAPLQIPNPHYVSIPMSIDVNAPVDKVWARVGKYCDIGEWSGIPCTIPRARTANSAPFEYRERGLVGKTKY